ncbi:MAG: acetyltransferase [Sulfuricurvum sp.]|uniref:acetyltransferase n=1 Tax=Sulfuricurvum sp. TaxID=2025608 RepID=UPI00261FADC8|nr:acetyltransferase [Sulfuricurvum sp.]MDD5159838.1 acetyltransferase [Sulfuricurvum sp.]
MEQNKVIYIYGASGHGRVIADIAYACGYTIGGWIDDSIYNDAPDWETFIQTHTSCPIALGIGNNYTRFELSEKITRLGYQLPALIHPSAIISPSAAISYGTVVMPLSVINAHAIIGKGVIVNSGAIIEHDCILGDYSHISPNAALAGNVTIGDYTHIGISATIIQNITVGVHALIGAGSVVIDHIPNNCTAVGAPSRIISSSLKPHPVSS